MAVRGIVGLIVSVLVILFVMPEYWPKKQTIETSEISAKKVYKEIGLAGREALAREVGKMNSHLHEPDNQTECEICHMDVYEKVHEMGKFSTQAIKVDGSVAFYDDIGCLLSDELANAQMGQKFVRDFNTLEWMKIEEATIVKTNLKTPMNWGYIYFINEADAREYLSQNNGTFIEDLEKIKETIKQQLEQKRKQQGG